MEKTVLVVDDSLFIYDEIKYMLEDTDYRIVGHAKDGAQAMRMYEKLKPDVVTMDIIMPGINGIDTSKLLLDRWHDAKIVIVSSLAYDETREESEKAGVSGFIFKPLEKMEFIEALNQATGQDSTSSGE